MNLANPILICDENEDFRGLLREMLTKNGFFHVLEAATAEEAIELLRDKDGYFILIESKAFTSDILTAVKRQRNFLVFADSSEDKTVLLSAQLGVEHVMSYPVHSRKLIEKINSLL